MNFEDEIERRVIRSVTQAIQKNKNRPINVHIDEVFFADVNGCRRYTGTQHGENEVYTDFIIEIRNTKGINISFKNVVLNESIDRLDIIVPNLKNRFINSVYRKLEEMGLEEGQDVPNIFGKIDELNKRKLIKGTYSVGGPIDYMYVDLSRNLDSEFDKDTKTLRLPGRLIAIDTFSKDQSLYLNLRPLSADQKYDPKLSVGGIKMIYGKSEINNVSGHKIFAVDSIAQNGIEVEII